MLSVRCVYEIEEKPYIWQFFNVGNGNESGSLRVSHEAYAFIEKRSVDRVVEKN